MNKQADARPTNQSTEAQPASASASASTEREQPASSINKPLRSGDVPPAIRSAPQAARGSRDEEIRTLRNLPYEQYLLTAWWRRMRNRALQISRYQCSRCQVTRELQVHHKTYDRLGDERDVDLEVLCRGCHLGLHVHEVQLSLGVYFKLISDVLKSEQFEMLADMTEAIKARCGRLKIPYHDGQVHAALSKLDQDKRLKFRVEMPRKYEELLDVGRDHAPLTRAEAAGWMVKLGAIAKSIPSVPSLSPHDAARHRASEIVAREIVNSIARCEEAERAVSESEKAAS